MAPSTVLFLCTGNYFRSRFAELFFNHHARAAKLPWQADSRGIAVALGAGNIGPISPYTQARLLFLGIPNQKDHRSPRQLAETDLATATRVIAVKEAEHRPMLDRRFPGWSKRVEFWHVDDIDCAAPGVALDLLEEKVHGLISELAAQTENMSQTGRAGRKRR